MSIYTFVEFGGEKYRIRQSEGSVLGYVVVVWDRHGWRQINRDLAREILKVVGLVAR